MIVCSVVMDYYSQLERVRRDTLMELQASVRSIYESLGARIQTRAHPVSASFSDAGPFSLFLAAEAIGRVERLLEERERTLRGAVVCVHRCDSSEEAARVYGTLRLNHKNPYGIRFSDQARASLRGYFDFKKAGTAGKWLYPVHVDMARGVDAAVLFSERSSPDPAWRVLPELLASGSRVLALEGYKPTRSLDAIADALSTHAPAARVVRLRACPSATMPFSPLMAAFSRAETDRSGMEETGREAGDATDKAFRLVARSLFADGKDRVLMTGCAEYIHDRLDDDGGRDTIALCDMPGQYSPEAQALVAERLRANRGRERYAILCPGNTPDAWQGAKPIVIPVEAPKQDVFEEAMLKALGESEEPLRGLLEQRFAALSGKRKHADQHAKSSGTLLSSLPEEAALYLYATLIAEGILETELLNEFLEIGRASCRERV